MLPVWQVKLLNLSRVLLVHTIPFVLSKVNTVSYGLLSPTQLVQATAEGPVPRNRRLLAVPYVGKDTPSLASEFSQPDVLISLTVLAYMHGGLRQTDVLAVLAQLKVSMESQFGPYEKRKACRCFAEWIEGAGARVRGLRPTSSLSSSSVEDVGAQGEKGRGNSSGAVPEVWPLHLVEMSDESQMGLLFELLAHQPQVSPALH